MKVLLIKPNKKSRFYCLPPLGLAYIASYLERNGIEVDIYDAYQKNASYKDVELQIKTKKYDVIGFECFPNDIKNVNKYIEIARKENPKIVSVIGGPFPSSAPEIALNLFNADYGIKGEGEEAMLSLCKNIDENGEIKDKENLFNLIWRKGKEIIVNKIYLEENLDKFGIPAWDKIPLDIYPPTYQGGFAKNMPVGHIETKRGCPYSCTFCAGPLVSGKKIRKRSLDLIMEDIDYQVKKFGIKEFHIRDDEFTICKEDIINFCEALLKKNYKLTWNPVNGIRLDSLDEEMLKLMSKAGCYAMHVGIECGNQKVLNNIKKELTKKEIKEKVELIANHNINVVGLFIIGIPGETKEEIEETIKFAKELKIVRAQFGIFLPIPGTALFNELIATKKINLNEINWEDYDAYRHIVYHSDLISDFQLKNLQRKAFLSFYLRPHILYKFLKDINSYEHFKNLFIRAINFLRK
ncbi:MAG TPA: radical SAM protein [bacterium]|nr:radical SAM protein [bacterium]HOL48337.1 radical SAM protein [bacterium]HPQ19977.1 radical SAM protein [bacterium]